MKENEVSLQRKSCNMTSFRYFTESQLNKKKNNKRNKSLIYFWFLLFLKFNFENTHTTSKEKMSLILQRKC